MKPATETQSLSAAAEVKRNWSIVQAIHISSPERETVIILSIHREVRNQFSRSCGWV
jgi:hypothetical protein